MGLSSQWGLKSILLDMDGVLWRENQPIVDLQTLFAHIADLNLQPFCVTNNSTASLKSFLGKLQGFGVELQEWQILTSAVAASSYLAEKFPQGGSVYVVGENGLKEELLKRGFTPVAAEDGADVLAVVAGLDRLLTYDKIRQAAHLIQGGALFIGTNPDLTLPTPAGSDPGAGAIISAIEAAANRPALILGKPQGWLFQLALQKAGCHPREALMVGDRLETDILGAQQLGLRTALVLSGISTAQEAENYRPGPDIIAKNALEVIISLA
jgi:4-nitrophenyl phosphatase